MLVVSVVELNILSGESVRPFCDEPDLVFAELLLIQRSNLDEVQEVSFDAGFRVVCLARDFSEGVAFEVEVYDNGFM